MKRRVKVNDLFVETVSVALFASRVALAADGLAGQRLQRPLLLRSDPFVVITVGARFRLVQTAILQKFYSIQVSARFSQGARSLRSPFKEPRSSNVKLMNII